MSNVFGKGTAPFYSVPQFLITSGLLSSLSAGAIKLYQLILFTAQKRTSTELELSNLDIRREAGLSPNTIRRARTKLKEGGLVDLKLTSGGRFTYVILNPLTGSPLPNPRSPPRGNSSATPSIPTPSSETISPPWSKIGK